MAAGLALVTLVSVGAIVLWPRPHRITRENFHRIRFGMTVAEVESILGPPGDYDTVDSTEDESNSEEWTRPASTNEVGMTVFGRSAIWVCNEALIGVEFDDANNIKSAIYLPRRPVDHGLLENLAWRVKRQWRKWHPEP
jgi:hypothetical protein